MSRVRGIESSRVRKVFLLGLVVIHALFAVGYGLAWMYYAQARSASASLGLVAEFDERSRLATITLIEGGSPAEAAGLVTGDRIRSANGRRLDTLRKFLAWDHSAVDAETVLVVLRNGADAPVRVELAQAVPFSIRGLFESSLQDLMTVYPVVFLGVGLTVLVLRPWDPHAWLMAMLFASFVTVPAFPRASSGLPPGLATFVLACRALGLTAIPTLFYAFFTRFPVASPLDRRVPQLKWLNAGGLVLYGLPGLTEGGPASPAWMVQLLGPALDETLRFGYLLAGIPLGVVALFLNALQAPTTDARRKARVLLWGTAAGTLPIVIQSGGELVFDITWPPGVATAALALSSVLPVSFAYAVVMHRVLDVPLLLRRSARYLLVRRGLVVLLLLLAAFLASVFTPVLSQFAEVSTNVAVGVSVAFGSALALGSLRLLRQATRRIDRAFFRHAYDAAAILERLAARLRTADSRPALADLLATHITDALHPAEIVVFLDDGAGRLQPYVQRWPFHLEAPEPDAPWIVELTRRGKIWDVSARSTEAVPDEVRNSQAELLVPILARSGGLAGYMVLGQRKSEEPYSGEDRRLLTSVANQAGIELENIQLAEAIAERLDAERAAERELAIARQVQHRLFPQTRPVLRTLEYAASCTQARDVGGDYYDFLAATEGRLALVVADIAGKGIAGALLMAHLQANLRAQYRSTPGDLAGVLGAVNRQFWENSGEHQYATLIVAEYDDGTRRLRVANCGHFPGFILRADGGVTPLESTSTVVGLFPEWTPAPEDHDLRPGDQFVLYTDGVIEARSPAGEDFGSARLLDLLRTSAGRPVEDAVAAVQDAVRAFAAGRPAEDDVTVVLARVH